MFNGPQQFWRRCRRAVTAVSIGLGVGLACAAPCENAIYLTFDTGHMGVADLIADVLKRQNVKATFFASNEATLKGNGSLSDDWAPWWKARAQEGHVFASHTYNHVYWKGDWPDGRWLISPGAGPQKGKAEVWDAPRYCEEIRLASDRLAQVTGQKPLPLFRAPGGKISESLLKAAKTCGYMHVGWTDAGFLGDELPSDKFPNKVLLQKALHNIRSGDILMAHLGIHSRMDPWAPTVLEPLIVGLKERGFCFATMREHPRYGAWTR
jgi:peptidoglycan/xylan/chitin deacetylase (PgdA/CDA1 family)